MGPESAEAFRNRKVLVTGGAGLIGQELVRQLLDRGAHVRATVFQERALALEHPRLEIVRCDLRQREACDALVAGMDVVLHAAAYIRGLKGQQQDRSALIMNNLLPCLHVLDASFRAGVERCGWISSGTIYPALDRPAREDDALTEEPAPAYAGLGWIQRYCERLSRYYHEGGRTKFAIVRASAVYGPHERFTLEDGHVLPALIIKAVRRMDPFPVWGDGQDVRDFVHVSDVVEGFLRAVERYAVCEPVNIGSGVASSINEALRIILAHEGYAPRIDYQRQPPNPTRVRLLDISKARRVLQYEPRVSLAEGLRETMDWYKATCAALA